MDRQRRIPKINKVKVRLLMAVVLLVPLWIGPCLLRMSLLGYGGAWAGVAASDVIGAALAGFLTNNYRFGLGLYAAATVLEMGLLWCFANPVAAMWAGDLFPSLVVVYFAQQLFINMGD